MKSDMKSGIKNGIKGDTKNRRGLFKVRKKYIALGLSVLLCVGGVGDFVRNAVARGDEYSKVVLSVKDLPADVRMQTLPVNASESDIVFPSYLSATLISGVSEEEAEEYIEEERPFDEGDMSVDESSTGEESAEGEILSEDVEEVPEEESEDEIIPVVDVPEADVLQDGIIPSDEVIPSDDIIPQDERDNSSDGQPNPADDESIQPDEGSTFAGEDESPAGKDNTLPGRTEGTSESLNGDTQEEISGDDTAKDVSVEENTDKAPENDTADTVHEETENGTESSERSSEEQSEEPSEEQSEETLGSIFDYIAPVEVFAASVMDEDIAVTWYLDEYESDAATFDSSAAYAGFKYVYRPRLAAEDSMGYTVEVPDGVYLPSVTVVIENTGMSYEDEIDYINSLSEDDILNVNPMEAVGYKNNEAEAEVDFGDMGPDAEAVFDSIEEFVAEAGVSENAVLDNTVSENSTVKDTASFNSVSKNTVSGESAAAAASAPAVPPTATPAPLKTASFENLEPGSYQPELIILANDPSADYDGYSLEPGVDFKVMTRINGVVYTDLPVGISYKYAKYSGSDGSRTSSYTGGLPKDASMYQIIANSAYYSDGKVDILEAQSNLLTFTIAKKKLPDMDFEIKDKTEDGSKKAEVKKVTFTSDEPLVKNKDYKIIKAEFDDEKPGKDKDVTIEIKYLDTYRMENYDVTLNKKYTYYGEATIKKGSSSSSEAGKDGSKGAAGGAPASGGNAAAGGAPASGGNAAAGGAPASGSNTSAGGMAAGSVAGANAASNRTASTALKEAQANSRPEAEAVTPAAGINGGAVDVSKAAETLEELPQLLEEEGEPLEDVSANEITGQIDMQSMSITGREATSETVQREKKHSYLVILLDILLVAAGITLYLFATRRKK